MASQRGGPAKKQTGFAIARRPFDGALILAGLAALLWAASLRAASIEEVDAEIAKANEVLKNAASGSEVSAEQRARILSDAVSDLHAVVEMIEAVPNLTPEERDRKASEVMATIFWCKKMTPLNMSGGSLAADKVSGKAPAPAGGTDPANQPQPAAAKAKPEIAYDELAFNRAKTFAATHSSGLEDCAARFESVAACYPGSKWAEKSLQEAGQIRTRLETRRNSQQPLMLRMEKLELDEILAGLAKDGAAEGDKSRLPQIKNDVEILQDVFNKFVKYAEGRAEPLNISFEELGVNRKGFIKSANKDGLTYTADERNAPPAAAPLAWGDLGAKATIRLAQKAWPTPNVEALVQRAVAATACEEYIVAQNCFSRLLNIAPERVKDLNAYFVRAQYGYTNSAEVVARGRFNDAKNLFKKKEYKGGMAALSELQQDLAANSSLATLLHEINRYRAASRRQYEIDDAGNPISQFEKVMRATFAGNIKVDEASGKVDAFYDFTDPAQFRDWTQVVMASGKAPTIPDWSLQKNRAVCGGQGGAILVWRFPLAEFIATADVVYQDSSKKVLFYACLTKDYSHTVWGWCCDGLAKVGPKNRDFDHGWYSSARFVWRAGDAANLRWEYNPDDPYPQQIHVNGNYGISGHEHYTSGGIGFGFEPKGTGSITNIHIRGKLDMTALKTILSGGQY